TSLTTTVEPPLRGWEHACRAVQPRVPPRVRARATRKATSNTVSTQDLPQVRVARVQREGSPGLMRAYQRGTRPCVPPRAGVCASQVDVLYKRNVARRREGCYYTLV